ncbi:hypothetical protein TSAR_008472 [Trichomalopsis sarcophagae]|uniref:Flexible cuticle protein 12 n=1 Tax=Trichomalopsis sarcophagae TaxID=543379 RepID=A0A232F0Z4_9HYME|nr:hypothetical protein TSAR_008472 [Trichomalopsis sarcophagae]
MKMIAVFAALLAVALAAPQREQDEVVLVKETPSDNIGLDSYRYGYELSNGQKHEESAQVETRSAEESVLRVRGSYSFVIDGITYTVNYVADENGFQPEGAHLPVAPIAVFAALLAVALAAPQREQDEVVLVKETPSDNIGLDSYRYGYELSNGQKHEESAQVETRSAEESVLRVRGSYSFVIDGITYTVNYVADENGFQPEGAHLPVAPIAVFAALLAVAAAASFQKNEDVFVVKETPSDNIGLDSYRFGYELSNGQTHEESAQVETRSAEESVLRVRGSFSWVNPEDGVTYTVNYVADENGFQPQGAHLPVAPVA